MSYQILEIHTAGEKFYPITEQVNKVLRQILDDCSSNSGVLHIFCTHTSCALCISENHDISAKNDLEAFMQHLAPRELGLITHTAEGPDDSPSHMKSILLQNSLSILIDSAEMVLGTWQGIFLCEFRDAPKTRRILVKFQAD